jgi:hypothetical protein
VAQRNWRGLVRLATLSVSLGIVSGFVFSPRTVESEEVLVSYWKLDEGTGETIFDSATDRSATLLNGATWTTGRIGAAVTMDGADDYIALPRIDVTGSAMTLSAWVRNTSFPTGADQRFISKVFDSLDSRTYWSLGQTNDGHNRLEFRLTAGGETTTLIAAAGDLPVDTWYHAAATYDGTTMRLYLNATEVGSLEKTGSISAARNASVEIGRSPDRSNYLRGAIDEVGIYSSALTPDEITALWVLQSSSNQPLSLSGSATRTVTTGSSTPLNQPPSVSLTSPATGATFIAQALITLSATASDADGTISRVDFYSGSTLIESDTSSPYTVAWANVVAGNYALTAVARDNGGATTVSSTRDIMVTVQSLPNTTVFVPSSNDATAVDRYVLEIFPLGANPTVANPVATRDLGKPAITGGECRADISSTIQALAPGPYIATITALGPGGSAQSEPAQFVR